MAAVLDATFDDALGRELGMRPADALVGMTAEQARDYLAAKQDSLARNDQEVSDKVFVHGEFRLRGRRVTRPRTLAA